MGIDTLVLSLGPPSSKECALGRVRIGEKQELLWKIELNIISLLNFLKPLVLWKAVWQRKEEIDTEKKSSFFILVQEIFEITYTKKINGKLWENPLCLHFRICTTISFFFIQFSHALFATAGYIWLQNPLWEPAFRLKLKCDNLDVERWARTQSRQRENSFVEPGSGREGAWSCNRQDG